MASGLLLSDCASSFCSTRLLHPFNRSGKVFTRPFRCHNSVASRFQALSCQNPGFSCKSTSGSLSAGSPGTIRHANFNNFAATLSPSEIVLSSSSARQMRSPISTCIDIHRSGMYVIVTDSWQKFSDVSLDEKTLAFLATYADEFLVHGVDVEGKRLGIDEELVTLLGSYSPIPVTYAGGLNTMADMERIKKAGMGRVDVTVGSALDLFGGDLPYNEAVTWHKNQQTAIKL